MRKITFKGTIRKNKLNDNNRVTVPKPYIDNGLLTVDKEYKFTVTDSTEEEEEEL